MLTLCSPNRLLAACLAVSACLLVLFAGAQPASAAVPFTTAASIDAIYGHYAYGEVSVEDDQGVDVGSAIRRTDILTGQFVDVAASTDSEQLMDWKASAYGVAVELSSRGRVKIVVVPNVGPAVVVTHDFLGGASSRGGPEGCEFSFGFDFDDAGRVTAIGCRWTKRGARIVHRAFAPDGAASKLWTPRLPRIERGDTEPPSVELHGDYFVADAIYLSGVIYSVKKHRRIASYKAIDKRVGGNDLTFGPAGSVLAIGEKRIAYFDRLPSRGKLFRTPSNLRSGHQCGAGLLYAQYPRATRTDLSTKPGAINFLDFNSGQTRTVQAIPVQTILSVGPCDGATAYGRESTTLSNQLFTASRWLLDLATGAKAEIIEDARG